MPSRYSSEHSKRRRRRTGPPYGPELPHGADRPDVRRLHGRRCALTGLAEENLQSRLRGTMLMAISNQEGHIVLAPGNKSELAVRLFDALRRLGGRVRPDQGRLQDGRLPAGPAGATGPPPSAARPRRSRRTPSPSRPSAELRPGQVDTDSLPDYDVLDRDPGAVRRPGPGPGGRSSRPGFDAELVTRVAADGGHAPSTSAASTRRAPRSPRRASARTAGCRSPTAGGRGPDGPARSARAVPGRYRRAGGGLPRPPRRCGPRSARRRGRRGPAGRP